MDEKRKWYGLTEDEWIALAVVLLAGLLFSVYFVRGRTSAETGIDGAATPIVIAEAGEDAVTLRVDGSATAGGDVEFLGTASPNAEVVVFLDGNAIGQTTADASGAWSLAHPVDVSGRFAAFARATDQDGRTADSDVATFRVTDAVAGSVDDEDDDQATAAESGDADDAGLEGLSDTDLVASAIPPTLLLAGSEVYFGPFVASGTAEAGSDIELLLDGETVATATTDRNGNWSHTFMTGDINYGPHELIAQSGSAASQPQMFVMRLPEKPTFDNNLDGLVTGPDTYRISGKGTPNWKVQYSVNNIPFDIPTDADGNWEDTDLRLEKPGCYQFRLAALDANGEPVEETKSGPFNVIVTEDGSPAAGVCPQAEEAGTGLAGDGDAADAASAENDDAPDANAGDSGAADDASSAADLGDDTADGSDSAEEGAPEGDTAAEDGASDGTADEAADGAAANIGAALEADGNYTTLLAAIEAAGLGDLLTSDEAVTLFAPSDAAFAELPDGAVDAYLANPERLGELLSNHVVAGVVASEDVVTFSSAEPPAIENIAGNLLTIESSEAGVSLNGARVEKADVMAGNSLIHGIDSVILPPFEPAPAINADGVPTFRGTLLTIVGTAAPDTILTVELNGEPFGQTVVGGDGNWLVSGDVVDGQYEIIAYTYSIDGLLLATSEPVNLTVLNE